MRKIKWISIVLLAILGSLGWYFFSKKSPSIPSSASEVVITLYEPYKGDLIVKKTISDAPTIAALASSLSAAKSGSDHKCASIGTISFTSEAETTALRILPGHDAEKYEFRIDGDLYVLPRSSYIDSLIAAGIDRDDIRLDGHPDISSDPPAGATDSKSEDGGKLEQDPEKPSQ